MSIIQKTGIILAFAFLAIVSIFFAKSYHHTSPSTVGAEQQPTVNAGDMVSVVIRTTGWTVFPTGGRRYDTKAIIINGVSLRYIVSVNNTNNPKELPALNEVHFGAPEGIHTMYFRLCPNQGYEQVPLPLEPIGQ